MGQPSRVIYLPPGVTPGPAAAQPAGPPPGMPTGIPFDRMFFQQVLPQAIAAFCQQVNCSTPLVELLTTDGTTHLVKGISGVADSWVALHTVDEEHDHDIQVFVPYQTIFRVEVHPAEDERRGRLGFVTEPPEIAAQRRAAAALKAEEPATPAPVAAKARKKQS